MSDFPFHQEQLQSIATARKEEFAEWSSLARMPLMEAAMLWLDSRRPFLAPRSPKDYERYIGTIANFCGNITLEKLANPDLVRAYQLERNKTAGAATINKECFGHPAVAKTDPQVARSRSIL
jgi:hypothetical protein